MHNYPQYYLLTSDEKYYCKVPDWLATTMAGGMTITYVIGPWIFINGFENTKEGKYLIKIFPHYFNLTPKARNAVNRILSNFGWWARLHKEYVEAMLKLQLEGV